jgi:hypothetical protein
MMGRDEMFNPTDTPEETATMDGWSGCAVACAERELYEVDAVE